MNHSVEGNTFLHSSISSGNNKEYLTAVFKYWLWSHKKFLSEHFAENTWLYDVRLQNYGVINFVRFFGPPCKGLYVDYIRYENRVEALRQWQTTVCQTSLKFLGEAKVTRVTSRPDLGH